MTATNDRSVAVRLERVLPAPPRDVYRAWLEPELLRRWLAPGGFTCRKAEVDARVGGRYRIWHVDAGSDVGGFECEIVELVPDERIVFRWGFVGPERTDGPVFDSLLTITLRAGSPGTTVLTLVHERLEELAAALPEVAKQVQAGWELVLEKLATLEGTEALRKVIVFGWMSLDGVVQAPAYADEDTSGAFRHGGWHGRYFEQRSMSWLIENLERAGGFLLGRKTYEVFAAHWPKASAEEQSLARPMNSLPKYVASSSLREPLAWQNSRVLAGNAADAVAALRRDGGKDLLLIGSTELAAELLAHDLVDELRLMIDPVVLGGGKRFFRDDGACHRLALVSSETTSTGAILVTYARSGGEPAEPARPLPNPPPTSSKRRETKGG